MKRSSTAQIASPGVAAAWAACALAAVSLVLIASPAQARFLGHHAKTQAVLADSDIAQVQRAIDEQRFIDAGRMLDQASLAGLRDPRLTLLTAELSLARGQSETALAQFRLAETAPANRAKAWEGEGIALSQLGHSEEALQTLQRAVAEDPSAWRAWNALGSEYDNRRDWTQAEAAYDHALADSGSAAIVLNNRGYSRLLQNRLDDAVADFVAALKARPDLGAARTNLRLAMAMRGDYDRALAGGGGEVDQAALLNNAGFAAILRGDYAKAQELLGQAMKVKGEYYGRASANLDLAHDLTSRNLTSPNMTSGGAAAPAAAPHADH
ncbi:MAG TPA: tetratricopeptide repeat protein [Caulobacteraceae bacterium]